MLLYSLADGGFRLLAKVLEFFIPLRFAKNLREILMASSGDSVCHVLHHDGFDTSGGDNELES